MKPTDFTVNTPGRLVHIALPPSGILDDSGSQEPYWAFVPAPLPPDIQLDNDTIVQLSQAALALGELRGVGQMLPNPHLLINPFMRREAVLSSRIEGTIAGLQQLLLFEEEPTETMEKSDVREVANYIRAME